MAPGESPATAPSLPGLTAAEALTPAADTSSAQDAAEAAQAAMGQAAAAAEALAQAHYQKKLPDLVDSKCGMKKPASWLASSKSSAAGGCMKRPASCKEVDRVQAASAKTELAAGMKRPAGLMKFPAQASSVQGENCPAKASPMKAKKRNVGTAAEMRRRLKLRPNGCGKCRYKPGCCPSCFQ